MASRKKEVTNKLREMYGVLIDPGTWITWIVENAPTRLAPIVAELQYLGMTSTNRDLDRLIAFHDSHRLYPCEALIQEWQIVAGTRGNAPQHMTIDQARAYLKELGTSDLNKVLAAHARSYFLKSISDFITVDLAWTQAWNRLSRRGRRMAVALCCLTDKMQRGESVHSVPIMNESHRLSDRLALPVFAWHPKRGLTLIESWTGDAVDQADVWFWSSDSYSPCDVGSWLILGDVSEDIVRIAELQAFWSNPPWLKQPPRIIVQPIEKARGRDRVRSRQSTAMPPMARQATTDEQFLKNLPPMQKLLEVARFSLGHKASFADKRDWIVKQLQKNRIDWDTWIWMAERYSTSPDAKFNVDALIAKICAKKVRPR